MEDKKIYQVLEAIGIIVIVFLIFNPLIHDKKQQEYFCYKNQTHTYFIKGFPNGINSIADPEINMIDMTIPGSEEDNWQILAFESVKLDMQKCNMVNYE